MVWVITKCGADQLRQIKLTHKSHRIIFALVELTKCEGDQRRQENCKIDYFRFYLLILS
jgi:hypothetical protein